MREPPPIPNKDMFQFDIPIIMLSENELNFSIIKPLAWLRRGIDQHNLTMKDIADKDHFILVNPEEIGKYP